MPWNEQGGAAGRGGKDGGGPWGPPPSGGGGGGGGSPWSRGPGGQDGGGRDGGGGGGGRGGGPRPPDFDGLFRRGQDGMRRLLPGGLGGGRAILLGVLALLLIWAASGLYRVEPDEQGVVLRFGKYTRTEQPGLRYHLPSPIETVFTPKTTRVGRIEIGFRSGEGAPGPRRFGTTEARDVRDVPDESLMLTGDENIIDIDFNVFWFIKDARQYLFKIRDPEGTVKKAAESAMREVIGRIGIQPALTEARAQIESQTRELLQRMLDSYEAGVDVQQVQLLKVDPPTTVVDAFNDVQRARADRERLRNEAETYRNDIVPRARGDAERMLQDANAYRDKVVQDATGDAKRFISVYDSYRLSKDVTAKRLYLETMEEVLRKARKIVIDPSAEGKQGVVPVLPLDALRPPTPTASPSPAPTPAPTSSQGGAR
ncbi:MAG: hflK [Rhodospirillales bacterium]|nr:hflK [Rhodospirillales bacterium]